MGGTSEATGGRSSRLGKAIALAVLVLSCAAAYWLSSAARQITVSNAGLTVSEEHLDFGEVWEDPGFHWSFPIKNTTGEEVEILEFVSSWNCLAIEPKSLRILPGQAKDVRLTLDLSGRCANKENLAIREVSVRVAPRIRRGILNHVGWMFRGKVRSALTFPSRSILFEKPLVRGVPFSTQVVPITAHTPLTAVVASCPEDVANVQVRSLREDQKSCALEIKPKESLPIGPFQFEIILRPFTRDAGELPPMKLEVTGKVIDEVQAVPSILLIGARALGSEVNEKVALQSFTGNHFQVEAIEGTGEETSVQPDQSPIKNGRLFQVQQRIARPGDQRHVLTFVVRISDRRLVRVPFEVLYYGLGAKVP